MRGRAPIAGLLAEARPPALLEPEGAPSGERERPAAALACDLADPVGAFLLARPRPNGFEPAAAPTAIGGLR